MASPGEVANLLLESESAVALTGAGLSKASGIPTFRDVDDGLWQDPDNRRWADRQAFDDDPLWWYEKFWEFYKIQIAARPTIGHLALRDMVNASIIDSVVTQNIDGLDLLAGTPSSRVFEMHGHDRFLSCTAPKCGFGLPMEEWLIGNEPKGLPCCLRDGQPLKPDVLLFNDDAPPDLERIYANGLLAVTAADTLMVVGTSLTLIEMNDLVSSSAKTGRDVVVINPNPTPADDYARLVVRATADEALPTIQSLTVN